MKTYKVEFDEVTKYLGTIKAESREDVKEIIYSSDIWCPSAFNNRVEPATSRTKIFSIVEISDD